MRPQHSPALALLALTLVCSAAGADDFADKELADLQKRVESSSGDADKLRADLIRFRRDFPGTPQAVRAAELQSRLPSPLDKLDPAKVPELERFDWHPKELVAVLGESRGRQAGAVGGVAYSPDGKLLVSGGSNGLVRLWDPATLRQKTVLGAGTSVTCVVFSRDGKATAVGNAVGQVYFWDLTGDKPKAGPVVRASTTAVMSLSLSPGGKLMATGSADSIVRVFDLTAEKEPKEKVQLGGHTAAVTGVAYAPDGKTLVSVSADMSLRLWEPGGDVQAARVVVDGAHKAAIDCVGFSPADARVLATGAADGTVKVWDLSGVKPKERAELATKAGAVQALAYTVTGKTLATAHADGTVHFWDAGFTPAKEKFVLEGHQGPVLSLGFAPNGIDFASGGADWVVRTWNLGASPRPKQRAEPHGHLSHVYASAFSPDDTTLATGSDDRAVRLWNVTGTAPKERASLTSEDNAPVYVLAWSPDGKMLASGGQSTTVRVWNTAKPDKADKLRQLKPNPGQVVGLAFAADNKTVLAASANTVVVWDANTTDEVRTLDGHEATVNCVAVSPDGKRAVTGAGQLKYENGQPVIVDGKYVYVDPVLRLFNLDDGKLLHAVKSYAQPVSGAAFSPDGRRVLVTTSEPQARQLDLSGPEPKEGEPVFSPDGKRVATVGPDASVVVWDAAGGQAVVKWNLPENVGHVSWAGDGRHLAVTAATGVVYVMRLR